MGVPSIGPGLAAPDLAAAHFHPFDEPRRGLIPEGFVEDGLTDYERHREADLWCVDERNQLHVGRSKPRSGTGSAER